MFEHELIDSEFYGQVKGSNAFLHNMVYEIRQPVGLVMSLAELIQKHHTTIPEDTVRLVLQRIVHASQAVDGLLADLYLLATIENVTILQEPLNMGYIVAEAEQQFSRQVAGQKVEISKPEHWPCVIGFGPWLVLVWLNLLNNAYKYGGQPPRIELGAKVQDNGSIYSWVKDNGNGLTTTEQQLLFKPFTPLNARRGHGVGLGLTIVERIITKLGGQVGVQSLGIPGQGSTFSFTLPGADLPKLPPESVWRY